MDLFRVIFEFTEGDDAATRTERRQSRLKIRQLSDPFLTTDEMEFIKLFRLNKNTYKHLCEELRPFLGEPKNPSDLSAETKVLAALSFYATGSYQRIIGETRSSTIAQQTVSAAIRQVTMALNSTAMRNKYIVFPKSRQERDVIKQGFYNKFGLRGVIGCIDGTHVAIVTPNSFEDRFFNRKHYHSINVQLICDSDLYIINVDASFGGASHDSFVWNQNPIKFHLEALNESGWLLGDSGYPLRKYLLTPYANPGYNTPEEVFNKYQLKTRNTVERAIGLLKVVDIMNGSDVAQEGVAQPTFEYTGRGTELQQGQEVRGQLASELWHREFSTRI